MDFSDKLIGWYDENRRDLPWRRTRDPYAIWISEIILQQTRVAQGQSYYERFIAAFPDVRQLAAADEETVLRLWQGLGYYSRARNLHHAARDICKRFKGRLPADYKTLLELKGIGRYTAAAIASIAFKQPIPVVDGNVFRVLSRMYCLEEAAGSGSGLKKAGMIAAGLMKSSDPGEFNQAMMEFGALVCTPLQPSCVECPFSDQCMALSSGSVDVFPVAQRKPVIKNRYFHYFVLTRDSNGLTQIALRKRDGNDIWKNLYDFPGIETKADTNLFRGKHKTLLPSQLADCKAKFNGKLCRMTHKLTHQTLHASFYELSCSGDYPDRTVVWADAVSLNTFPLPRLISRYMHQNTLFRSTTPTPL